MEVKEARDLHERHQHEVAAEVPPLEVCHLHVRAFLLRFFWLLLGWRFVNGGGLGLWLDFFAYDRLLRDLARLRKILLG